MPVIGEHVRDSVFVPLFYVPRWFPFPMFCNNVDRSEMAFMNRRTIGDLRFPGSDEHVVEVCDVL